MTEMETHQITVRRARPEDAPLAGRLLYETSVGEAHLIFGDPESQARELAISASTQVFPIAGHVQSHDHAAVAECDSQACGVYLAFDRKEWCQAQCGSYKISLRWARRIPIRHIPRVIRFLFDMGRAQAPLSEDEYYIEFLAVSPERRRQGVGRALIGAAEQAARERGLKKLALDVDISNASARRFYDRLGFLCVKVTAGERFTRYGLSGQMRMIKNIADGGQNVRAE